MTEKLYPLPMLRDQQIEHLHNHINKLESRNKLLEAVLEAAEKFLGDGMPEDQKDLILKIYAPVQYNLVKAITAARSENEKES